MTATGLRQDPFASFRFHVTLKTAANQIVANRNGDANSGAVIGAFSECTGLGSVLDVHEYKEGGVNDIVHKFPTRVDPTEITLKRGIGVSDDLWSWLYGFAQGCGERKDGMVVLMDEAGNAVKRWVFKRGMPKKWSGPDLNASQSAVAIEMLEISHEGLEMVPL